MTPYIDLPVSNRLTWSELVKLQGEVEMGTFVDDTICAIGIDFGTSGTGYAFAFKHNKCKFKNNLSS